jgi:large subunit ribosomal protein L9
MAKVEVILTKHIVGLGAESDQVRVTAGYARNYLLPQGFAIPVTAANKRRLEALQTRRAEREAHELNTMTELAAGLAKLLLVVKVKTGDDGKLHGSVTAGTIADELKHQFEISLDKRKIHLEKPIRALGEFAVEMRLHPEVNATLKMRVETSNPVPLPAEPTEAPGPAESAKAEGRRERPERRGGRPRAPKAEQA